MGTASDLRAFLSLILSLSEVASCWPPAEGCCKKLTGYGYSPSQWRLSAFCRESTCVFGTSGRKSASSTARDKKWLLPNKRPRVSGLKKKVAATKGQTVTEERRAAERTRLRIVADMPHALT